MDIDSPAALDNEKSGALSPSGTLIAFDIGEINSKKKKSSTSFIIRSSPF
jgi:hypothetical protein